MVVFKAVSLMPALEIIGLKKTYANGTESLKGVDLRVEQGDFFALLGANGAGKSTTIGIIASLINKSAGRVKVYGHDIDHSPLDIKRCIGLVPQEFNFNQFEPVEEIVVNQGGYYGMPRAEAKKKAEHYLKKLDLWSKRKTEARQLSGGMKRRLMIARALVHEPKLLILDEPTAGVDIEIRQQMWEFLTELNASGTTIILTTHYLEEAEQLCRNIAIIKSGSIFYQCNMSELLAQLDTEQIVLQMSQPLTATLPDNTEGISFAQIAPDQIEVSISKKHSINYLFTLLTNAGIEVSSLRNKKNRLEQLFMDVVNKVSQ